MTPEQQVIATLDRVSERLDKAAYLELLQTLKDDLEMRIDAVEGEIRQEKTADDA